MVSIAAARARLRPLPGLPPSPAHRDPLYPVVQHHLTCGILAHGFARLRCYACAQERLLAFSCKGRGVCPSCTTRRMAEVAAHLTDHVIPHVPARQWVLSLPKRLRPYLTHDPALVGRILAVLLRIIRGALRERGEAVAFTSHEGAGPGVLEQYERDVIGFVREELAR